MPGGVPETRGLRPAQPRSAGGRVRLGERAARSLRQDTRTLRAGRARGKADVAQLQPAFLRLAGQGL